MNLKFNVIFVGFFINLSNGCITPWGKSPEKPVKQDNRLKAIRYNRQEISKMTPGDIVNLHHAFTFQNRTWKDGQVNYELDEFNDFEKKRIFRAIEEIQNSSCIRFVQFNKETHQNFVKIRKDNVAKYRAESSHVGCEGKGQQDMWFGYDRLYSNDYNSIVLHHLLHLLGFFHHSVRSDRDKYIEFHMENTNLNDSVIASDFVKLVDIDLHMQYLTRFDFNSVMLDNLYYFSANGEAVIVPKIGLDLYGGNGDRGLSALDKYLINHFYKCTGKLIPSSKRD